MQGATSGAGTAGRTIPPMGSPRRSTSITPISQTTASQLTQHMAQSMTIDEMRALHHRAMTDADAKRTELRLVLASRYRELVGSSDEVIKMKERAQELNDLVKALPQLIAKLTDLPQHVNGEAKEVDPGDTVDPTLTQEMSVLQLRRELSLLPRAMYRALDAKDVHKATLTLIQLFTLIAQQTDEYPLANELSQSRAVSFPHLDPTLEVQIRMTFLQVQSLPDKIRRISHGVLAGSASYGLSDGALGITRSASALASLHCLESRQRGNDRAEWLLTTYFESKAKILVSLLNQLTVEQAANAEDVLSKIVLILQFDIIMHPYQIFCLRKFPASAHIMTTVPLFDMDVVKAKCSKCVYAADKQNCNCRSGALRI
jgi:Vps51/Vps67